MLSCLVLTNPSEFRVYAVEVRRTSNPDRGNAEL